jgi:tRNA threonylcarbamoyladenosine biosynthesis protein TsaB
LAIDTVTEACSVALWQNGDVVSRDEVVSQRHTELILPMVEAILAESETRLSQLDAIVFDRGPGSFTGLRIGAGVTQGLALGHDLPVIPVSSLATLAQGAWRLDGQASVISCIDARQAEVYWAAYQLKDGIMVLETDEQLGPATSIRINVPGRWFGVGTGFVRYAKELGQLDDVSWLGMQGERYPLACDTLPTALAAWQRREYLPASDAIPVYLRNNVATPPSR